MKTIQDIKAILKREMPFLKKEYAVTYLGIFGSYARNEQNKESDVDLLVDFDPNEYPGFKFFDLEDYLSTVLNSKIDLVPRDALKRKIGDQIRSEVEDI